jgi:formate/nitrite transporter FocA (FNT family)
MKYLKCFASGVLAGLFIGLGSFAFCACQTLLNGKFFGSLLFSLGLFLVCLLGTNLFTGKIGFAIEKVEEEGPLYILQLLLMLAGNFVGAAGSGALLNLALSGSDIVKAAQNIATARTVLGDGAQPWYKALIMAVFCGILVFLAVFVWKKAENFFVKTFGLVFCVWVFVVTGTEHCIANMFYYAFAGSWSLGLLLDVLLAILGNSIGALVVWALLKFIEDHHKAVPQA